MVFTKRSVFVSCGAWHFHTVRCHAFSIAACLLCTASFFSCILLDLPCLNQLVGSLPRLFYFSSYSVLLASEISLALWFSAATRCSWLLKSLLACFLKGIAGSTGKKVATNRCWLSFSSAV